MPRLCANLSLLFADLPFVDRFAAAAYAGFRAVECQFPYAVPAMELAQVLRTQDLRLELINLPAGNWEGGERGIAVLPDRVEEFRAGVGQALDYALALGVPRINCLAGIVPATLPAQEVTDTLVGNLRHAASRLAQHGLELLVEPINSFDIPGFGVSRLEQALELLGQVGADNVRVQYDLYHATRMGDDVPAMLRQHLSRIGHIQIADVPGRHEPGTGSMAYRELFALLDALGYSGQVGCEYLPLSAEAAGTQAGLAWIAAHGLSLQGDGA